MDPDVYTFAGVAIVIVCLVGSLTAIGLTAWRFAHRKDTKPTRLPDADDRIERLQQSLDAIAIEVERISESQRFTAKLLVKQPEEERSIAASSSSRSTD